MLYVIYQIDKPNGQAIRAAQRAAHLTYLDDHEDILVLGGAMLAEDGTTRTGSVLIINVLARPGTPSKRQWPRLKSEIKSCSMTSS